MLSIGKMVAGAEDYYLAIVAQGREEYYTGAGESPGMWLGRGDRRPRPRAAQVSPEDLAPSSPGSRPHGRITAGAVRPRPRGWPASTSPSRPPSPSPSSSASGPRATRPRSAAPTTTAVPGPRLPRAPRPLARRGAGGQRRIGAEGLVAAAFVHRTSRAGDPQLHTHVLVANAGARRDGRWSAPDARLLYFHARTAGFVYQASLRAGLVESLGVALRSGTAGRPRSTVVPVVAAPRSPPAGPRSRSTSRPGRASGRTAEWPPWPPRAPKGEAAPSRMRSTFVLAGGSQACRCGVDPGADLAERREARGVVIWGRGRLQSLTGRAARRQRGSPPTIRSSSGSDVIRVSPSAWPAARRLDAIEA